MLRELDIRTTARDGLIDITGKIAQVVADSGMAEGVCHIFCPHTTAGITINENADPHVAQDMLGVLDRRFPQRDGYLHYEGNSAAHLKASLIGASETIIVSSGRLMLGTWQGIYFAEFDGPRRRRVLIKVTPDP
jgi:secondary thiamine-phosphate synthase enzyme